MLYEATNNHDGLWAGQLYELEPEDVEHRAEAIAAGFLVPVAGFQSADRIGMTSFATDLLETATASEPEPA